MVVVRLDRARRGKRPDQVAGSDTFSPGPHFARVDADVLRASTISPSQLAIRIKILFPCLVGRERRGKRRRVGSQAFHNVLYLSSLS
jgi:hypothetical protein